jgi:uncharacterized protein
MATSNSGFGRLGKRYAGIPQIATANMTPEMRGRQTIDEFANVLARLGFGTNNLMEGTSYPLTRLGRNYILMTSLYRSNWLARKVVDTIPEDMMKNWVEFHTDLEPQYLKQFENVIRKTQTRANLLKALKWGRLYGGAAAIMVIDGQDDLMEPLDFEDVELDSYRGLIVVDRWSGIFPGAQICDDVNNPVDFGLPEYYRVTAAMGHTFEVHCSRVLRFIGRDLPRWEKEAEIHWGISEYELLWSELRKRDNTSGNIASLIFRANILAMRSKNLEQLLATGSAQNQTRILNTMQSINHLMSNQGLLVLPEEGGLEQHAYSFGGLNDIYQSFMMDISGATEIPLTRLFGRTQTGLGQSNQGDEQIYFGMLAQKQEREVSPLLDKLLPVIAMSTWGEVPNDFDYSWRPIRELNDQEMAQLSTAYAGNVITVFSAGLISQRTALLELKQMSSVTGQWTNLTDEMIAAADDTVMSPADQMAAENGGGEDGEEPPPKGDK